MTPSHLVPDDADRGLPARDFDDADELYDEPFELDVSDEEEVGLDAEAFDEGLDQLEMVGEARLGSVRFDDAPLDLPDEEPDEGLETAGQEYGLCEGHEPSDMLDDELDPLFGTEFDLGWDEGEEGALDDEAGLDLEAMPPLQEMPEDTETGPLEPLEAMLFERSDLEP